MNDQDIQGITRAYALRYGSLRHRAEPLPARSGGRLHIRTDPVQVAVRESPYAAALLAACMGWGARTKRGALAS